VLASNDSAVRADELLGQGFVDPPDSARPWVFWFWINSYVNKAGITDALESMKSVGIRGALILDAREGMGKLRAPAGPRFMSRQWQELFKYAVVEADRLGLQLSLNLCSGWDCGGPWITPEHAIKDIVWSEVKVQGPAEVSRVLAQPKVVDDFYRDVAVIAYPNLDGPGENRTGLKQFETKVGRKHARYLICRQALENDAAKAGEEDTKGKSVKDLTDRMDPSGRLVWNVPKGDWTIVRFGMTLPAGPIHCGYRMSKVKFASPGGDGYEVDWLSSKAIDFHFRHMAEKLIADLGPLVGKTLKYVHDDSWECSATTWTADFRREFKQRRGYDMMPYLPVLTGRIVDSREISNRFLWDYRRTIGDCIAENHYGRFRDLAHKHGMGIDSEAGGPWRPYIDALEALGKCDIPMGEAWARNKEPGEAKSSAVENWLRNADSVRQAASATHTYGKPIVEIRSCSNIWLTTSSATE